MRRQQRLLYRHLVLLGCGAMLLLAGCRGIHSEGKVAQARDQSQTTTLATAGVYHEVKAGQTLWSIARAYQVKVQALAQTNRLSDTAYIYVGQKLLIPGATSLPSKASKAIHLFARSTKHSPASRTVSAQNSPQESTALEGVRFIWPIQGQVSRGFEQGATKRHDGIDLAAPRGVPIRAAAHGEVMFSGWGPGGYGRTVILKHHANLITIYAHNHENLVQVGQNVRQGESIATVGQSGRATGTHLHFEVRHKATPISPYTVIPSRPNNLVMLSR